MKSLGTQCVRRAFLGAAALAGLAGCGSSSSTTGAGSSSTEAPTLTPGSTSATSSTSASTTPASTASTESTATSGGPPSVGLLHSVHSSSGFNLRVNGLGGGWHSVGTLPPNSFVSDVSHGEALVFEPGSTTSIVVVDLVAGTVHNVATDVVGFGGAISPDGIKAAYIAPGSTSGFVLRVATIATGSSQVLATYATGPVPDPVKWGADGILADLIVPNSDAPTQGATRIDPSSGQELARSSGVGQHGLLPCGDGDHVLTVDHTPGLGDDNDAPPGPGPQGNPNTLRLVTVGGTQTIIKKAAHHQIQALACPSDGRIAVFQDGSSAGGFAGISQSPDFGLFLVHDGATRQLDHYGTIYDGATVYQDGESVAAAKSDSTGSTVVEFGPSRPFGADNVPGAQGGGVDLVFFGG